MIGLPAFSDDRLVWRDTTLVHTPCEDRIRRALRATRAGHFEGLSGHLHAYKVDVAKAMLTMCRDVGSKLLLMVSSTLEDASPDPDCQARDLRKLATLAMPLNIRIAYEPLSWGKYVSDLQTSWDLIEAVYRVNTGLVIDSFQMLATAKGLEGDDYAQLPLSTVTDRARRSVKWLTSQVARRSLPARHAVDMG